MISISSNGVRIGVDIGGTFTDLMLITESGDIEIGKVLTTSEDPSQAVEEVLLASLEGGGRTGDDVRHLVHGTTLVTNAIIERKGATTALMTSSGFRDSIEIGREHRWELYDLMLEHPKPIVPTASAIRRSGAHSRRRLGRARAGHVVRRTPCHRARCGRH